MASNDTIHADIAVNFNCQTDTKVRRDCRGQQNTKIQERDVTVNVWSPTHIVLSLATLMLVERGSLDVDEKISKYWPEYMAEGKNDVQVRQILSGSLIASGSDKLVTTEDVSKLVQRTDGRSLEQFTTDEIAKPLRADLCRRLVVRRQHECQYQSQLQHPADDLEVQYGSASKHNLECSGPTTLTRVYPEAVPPHRFHPYVCDFSVIDQGPIGKALLTHRRWQQGDFMARFDGMTVPEVMLHTLQKSDRIHLWDPHFIGNLAHSCNPNVMLDMAEHEMWAVKDIEPGTVLSMDYASTEDHLFRTFQCQCTASGCRGEVTGRKQRRSGYISINQKSI